LTLINWFRLQIINKGLISWVCDQTDRQRTAAERTGFGDSQLSEVNVSNKSTVAASNSLKSFPITKSIHLRDASVLWPLNVLAKALFCNLSW
jgi:hypothetical protein